MAFEFYEGFDSTDRVWYEHWNVFRQYGYNSTVSPGYNNEGSAILTNNINSEVLIQLIGQTAVRIGFALNRSTTETFYVGLVQDTNVTGWPSLFESHAWFTFKSDGTITAQIGPDSGTTDPGDSVEYVPPSTWVWVEIYGENSNGGAYELRVNGATALQGTWNPTGRPWNHVYFGEGNQATMLDDIMIYGDATGTPWWGPSKVRLINPTGTATGEWLGSDGNSVDNHLLVDDGDKDSVDYVSSVSGSNQTDEYTFTSVSGGQTVHGVATWIAAEQDVAGASGLSTYVKSGATEGNASNISAGVGSPSWVKTTVVENDPATGISWTPSGADAVRLGVRTQAV